MQTCPLYPLLLLCVLLLAGCGAGEPDRPTAPAPDAPANPAATDGETDGTTDARVVLFLGNSLSAGYGLDPDQAFPALVQQKIDSLGWDFQVINAGISGETTAGGLSRIDWLLRQRIDVLVLELGGNDGLRGIAPEVTAQNLQAIIDKTYEKYPEAEIVVAGMQVPPNLGSAYTTAFRDVFPAVARANDAHLIPFLLADVGGIPRLNLPDGIHPTAEGHVIVANTVWETLWPVLETIRTTASP